MMALKDDLKSKAVDAVSSNSERIQKTRDTIRRAQKVAKLSTSTFSNLASVLMNPATWVAALVVALLFSIVVGGMAVSQTFGRNENADGCFGIGGPRGKGGGSVNVPDTGDMWGNANAIATWLLSHNFAVLGNKPMTLNQAAGILGNWGQESMYNPSAVQPGQSRPDLSNEEILSWGDVGGKAIGLAQWDGVRRPRLVQFAQERGVQWNDMSIQLEFFAYELENEMSVMTFEFGFNDITKNAEEMVIAFEKGFERAGKPHYERRIQFANDFLAQFNGGYAGGTSGGSCTMNSANTLDTSDVAQLAARLSYPTSGQSYVDPSDLSGQSVAKAEYIQAKKQAMDTADRDPLETLYASCDRFVATVLKLTVDKDVPWGATSHQTEYFANSPNWERYTKKSEAKPGDVWVTQTSGHIILYIGDVNGTDSIAHASYQDRVAGIDPSSYLNENLVDTSGRAYYGYRFVGERSGNGELVY